MNIGDTITFKNKDFNLTRECTVVIVKKTVYNSFEEYLTNEKLKRCLPGIDTIKDGVSIYHSFYPPHDEEKYKVIAIKVKVIK
jgi:ASC-1-like (ASCH) protein